jgi:hypothetical protein
VYDLKVSTTGTPSLGPSNATIYVGTAPSGPWTKVVDCTGDWAAFNTPQSVFNRTYFGVANAAGLKLIITNAIAGGSRLYVRAAGNAGSGGTIGAGYTATITLYIQATGSISK